MVRYGMVGLALWVLAAPASAGTWADALFEELSRDFGSVPRGSTLSYPFRLVNNTGNTVRISNIRVTCGCTTAKALQNVLGPGQETAILVTMDTRRFYHTKNVTVFVQFDLPRSDEVRLWVQANSRDDVAVLPDTLNFGRIKRGTGPAVSVNVSFLGADSWKVEGLSCESNYIQPSIREIARNPAEVNYELTAKVRPDAPAGKWFTDVWLSTNNPGMSRIRVPLTVEIEAPVTVSPTNVTLGQVKKGSETERKVILRGVSPFKITRILGTDKQVQVRGTTSESRTVHVLSVSLRPSQAGDLNRTIRVQTDLIGSGEVEFFATAHVVP